MADRLSLQPDRLARAAAGVLPALQAAAARTGVDFQALYNTARLESGFRPAVKAATSSATGLFQFIDSTWLSTLARHGPRHGISAGSRAEALALRNDPAVASLMAAEHMADNAATLEAGLGRAVGGAELYLAHFLGSGGAIGFLKALAAAPDQAAAARMPAAARANRAIFYEGGMPRSLQQVHDLIARRFNGTSVPAASGSSGNSLPAAGTFLPPALANALQGEPDLPDLPADPASPPPVALTDPRRAAQAAYLLLAELGA